MRLTAAGSAIELQGNGYGLSRWVTPLSRCRYMAVLGTTVVLAGIEPTSSGFHPDACKYQISFRTLVDAGGVEPPFPPYQSSVVTVGPRIVGG